MPEPTIPRSVIRDLSKSTARNPIVRGSRGRPNIRRVAEDKHQSAHSSSKGEYFPGGNYNKAFDEAIEAAGGYKNVSPEQVRAIADQLMKEFFGP